ncbi:MAG: amidohydrolase family protein [Asgard group archaeon]|nr:amidohydrolase family protein [Asgard group archaeon]
MKCLSLTELLILDGMVVFENKQLKRDIRVIDEKIVEIGDNLQGSSNDLHEINAKGLTILPGGIDPHVHLSLPDYVPAEFQWIDDFESGSKAALAGGITSLGCISVPDKDESPLGTLKRESEKIQKQAIADVMIHPVIFNPTAEVLQDIPKLLENGCSTIKIFMVTDDFDANMEQYIEAIKLAGENGLLTMIHCEDNKLIKETCEKMIEEGKGSLVNYADSRPLKSETIATEKAVEISKTTGAPIYVVHLSSKAALKICEKAQKQSVKVYVEGRPIFLYLTREEYQKPEGAIYVVQPPLREKSDNEALWKGVMKNSIQTLATDHAPHTREQKLNPTLNVSKLVPGINELQLMLPMFHHKGVVDRKISLQRFVELTSTNTAKLFGLYPKKGTIKVGSDADLVLWDFAEEREIKDEDMFSKAGFSIYAGQTIKGWPKITIRRGEIVYKDGEILSKPGSGKVLMRNRTQALI